MTKHADSGSVFTDDSGVRRRVITWSVRGTIVAIVLAAAGLVLALGTQVTLPGLDGPLSVPGVNGAPGRDAAPADDDVPADASVPGQTSETQAPETATVRTQPTAGPTSPATPGGKTPVTPTKPTTPTTPTSPGTPSTPSTPTPTTPGSKGNRGTAADVAPRADPTHGSGAADKTPPGQTK